MRAAEYRQIVTFLAALLLAGVSGCEHRVPAEEPKYPRDMLSVDSLPDTHSNPLPGPEKARPAAFIAAVDDGQWLMPLKDYAGTRYSALADVDTATVRGLKLAWHHDLQLARGQEATPLVVGSTMYVVTSFPNLLYAFDLARSGAVRWVYDPQPERAAQGAACCDTVNRGAVFTGGNVIYATLDGNAVAVDAGNGAEVWRTPLADIHKGETITMAPLAVRNLVIFGNSGGEFGVRGWLKALDVGTGTIVWTAYSTGPDHEILIGPSFRPFYAKDRGENLGVSTWRPEQWKIGGGTVWGWLTYDPELDLIYSGTGNAAPWNTEQRPGDNKWTGTIFARRPDTGEAVWAYQWDPHSPYGWDGVNESTLLDLPAEGGLRRVLVRAERNGLVYVMDRASGEVLSATPYVHSTVATGVDGETGEPILDTALRPQPGTPSHGICPATPGAKGWEPTAFSPRTGLLYIPANNLCMDMEGREANYISGTPYVGASVKMYPGPGGHRGEIVAWDPVNRRKVWTIRESFVTASGPLATAGDLVFYGTMDRWLKAVDARSGKEIWRFRTDTGIVAPPITFRGPDRKQYIAVLSGPGGWPGSVVSLSLDPRDKTAARGYAEAMHDLPQATGQGGHLYVFGLP